MSIVSTFNLRNIFFISALIFLSVSVFAQKISSQNYSYRYNYDASKIHPEFVVFDFNKDSTRVFTKIYPNEFLYKKEDGTFVSNVKIMVFVFENCDTKNFIDSTSLEFSDVLDTTSGRYLVAHVDLKSPLLENYLLKVRVRDVNRNFEYDEIMYCKKNALQSNQSFYMRRSDQDYPFFAPAISSYDEIHIEARNDHLPAAYARFFENDFSIAPPPMRQNAFVKYSYYSDSTFFIHFRDDENYTFSKQGLYHFQYDSLKKTGYTVFRFSDEYPLMNNVYEMIEATRYITSKKEYDKMIYADKPQAMFTNFWENVAGGSERAKSLINEYYSRVQNANKYFTSYMEGWKTDRGLIYIVFGKPDGVFNFDDKETWLYYSNGLQNIEWNFEKVPNPFTQNDYILMRSEEFQVPWNDAVNVWRSGHIFNDK